MNFFLTKPWGKWNNENEFSFKLDNSLNAVLSADLSNDYKFVTLSSFRKKNYVLFPYPKKNSREGINCHNFPQRFRKGGKEKNDIDKFSESLTNEMENLIQRVLDLELSLEDPSNVWINLRESWRRAEKENDPLMAEIVRQAESISSTIKILEKKFRRILRRDKERIQLDRVQELDKSCMRWISKQPGRNLAERAGSDQRILAIVRKENFNTLENRALNSYLILAKDTAISWLKKHSRASNTVRYNLVNKFKKQCHSLSNELINLGVGHALPNISPNYVLMQDRNYNQIYKAWLVLLRNEMILDDIWSWQSHTWIDFCLLAITLSLNELSETQIIAQSPIVWQDENQEGRWFSPNPKQPFITFWLKETKRIIEIFVRPEQEIYFKTRCSFLLKIYNQDDNEAPRSMIVWTPHSFLLSNLNSQTKEACEFIYPIPTNMGNIRNGLILTPGHENKGEFSSSKTGNKTFSAIAVAASGVSLAMGMKYLGSVLRNEFLE